MTIEEAIVHARQVAEENRSICAECAEQHEQLAEWLIELRKYRLFTEKCASSSYTVNSKIFAEHIKYFIEDKE